MAILTCIAIGISAATSINGATACPDNLGAVDFGANSKSFVVESFRTVEPAPEPAPRPVTVQTPADYTVDIEIAPSIVQPKPPPPPPPVVIPDRNTVQQVSRSSSVSRAASAANGQIPGDALCGLSWDPSSLLRCDAAAALEAAAANGMPTVGMTDAYRSYADQVAVKASRGSWAAKPGTSNHGFGVAIDIPEPARSWLHNNGAAYGWINPDWAKNPSRHEPWHFEFVG